MCGRFTLTSPSDELAGYFDVLVETPLSPRYNIAPTQPVACVRRSAPAPGEPGREGQRRRELVELRWGLIPYWAKDPAIGNRMINARAESVADKPAYREAFRQRRCLVVADGFYEWKKLEGGKQPYFICMRDRRPFVFAGLWERWKPRAERGGNTDKPGLPLSASGRVESCAFVTTTPNDLLQSIHDRMPVILPPESWDDWLDPDNHDADRLRALLLPYPADRMQAYAVSTHVNKPINDDPSCIEPLRRPRIVRPRGRQHPHVDADPHAPDDASPRSRPEGEDGAGSRSHGESGDGAEGPPRQHRLF